MKLRRPGELPDGMYYGEARCLDCPWSMTYGSLADPPQVLFAAVGGHSEKCPGPVLLWTNTQEPVRFFIVDGPSTVS